MLENYVANSFAELSRSSLYFPLSTLNWWINPLHLAGLAGGAFFGYRGHFLGIIASGLCVMAPELGSALGIGKSSFDPTPLFADTLAYTSALLPPLSYHLFLHNAKEYREKGYIRDSPILTVLFRKANRVHSHLSSSFSLSDHINMPPPPPPLSLPAPSSSSLKKLGYGALTVAGLYGLYTLSQSPDVSSSFSEMLHATSISPALSTAANFFVKHPAVSAGLLAGALTGYLQQSYTKFAGWSGQVGVAGISFLQFQFDPLYTPGNFLLDNGIGLPVAFLSHLAGWTARDVQHKLIKR